MQLSASSLTDGLSLTASTGSTPWLATITSLAIRECGELVSMSWNFCGGTMSIGYPIITMKLPEPVAVRITTSPPQLAPQSDIATGSGINWRSLGSRR